MGASSVALQAESTRAAGSGIRGYASATSGTNYGVVGESKSPDGYGGYFYNNKGGTGVYGEGKSGGYFTTNQAGTSADRTAGLNVTTAHQYSYGVRAYTSGDHSDGVVAYTKGDSSTGVVTYTSGDHSTAVYAYADGDNSDGVRVSAFGDNSDGVHAYSGQGYGVYGAGIYGIYGKGDKSGGYFTTYQGGTWDDKTAGVNATTAYVYSNAVRASTTGDDSEGVYASTTGENSHGVYAESTQSDAIYAHTGRPDHKYGVRTPDYMYAAKYEGGGSDVAEYFAVAKDAEPGTVMVIGEDSKLQCSGKAYDTTVAGIVSTAPGVSLGTNDDGNIGEKLIAVAGRVPCKVDASYAPIEPGDLLTTSDTPGHAMKATDPQIGTILGKALVPLDSGTGVIEVLVTLQ